MGFFIYICSLINLKKDIMTNKKADPEFLQFGKSLVEILNIYTEDNFSKGDKEPLDGDEVDDLIKILHTQLNFINGNITSQEYDELLK